MRGGYYVAYARSRLLTLGNEKVRPRMWIMSGFIRLLLSEEVDRL